MPRSCTVCTHAERSAIETALLGTDSFRDIAGQFGVSRSALTRHKAEHISDRLTQAKAAAEVSDADDLLAQVRALRSKSLSILLAAEKAGDLKTALGGIREARACIELLARLSGELADRATVNIITSPQWTTVYRVIVANLDEYPELRATIAGQLLALDRGHVDR